MAKIVFRPLIDDGNIVKFNRAQLEDLLDRLDESGANEIGVAIRRE